MCSEIVKNRQKSVKCALSMVLLGIAMATLVGCLFLIEEIDDCFKEYFSHLNSKIYFLAKSEAKIRR